MNKCGYCRKRVNDDIYCDHLKYYFCNTTCLNKLRNIHISLSYDFNKPECDFGKSKCELFQLYREKKYNVCLIQ